MDYISREKTLESICEYCPEIGKCEATNIRCTEYATIKAIPAADVRPVVLCKDCKYCLQTDEFEYWCNGFCNPARLVRKEDFCSHGAKMDGET